MTQRGGGVGVAPSGLVSSFDGHVGAVTLANTDLDRVRAIVSKTANYTAADGDYVVGDTTGGAFTVTLPAAVAGGYIVVELRTGSPALTVHNLLGGDVILTGARAGALCFSDGTNWHAIVSEGSGTFVSLTATALQTANVTAAVGQLVRCDTSVGTWDTLSDTLIVTCPANPTVGATFAVKKEDSVSPPTLNAIKVLPQAGTIDGLPFYYVAIQYEQVLFTWDGTNWGLG